MLVKTSRFLACRRLVLAASAFMAGCGGSGATDDLPRSAVSGKVTLDDKPLESGSISFDPEPGVKDPVSVGGVIKDGSYSIDKASGPTPGSYRVAIQASDATSSAIQPGVAPGETPRVKSKSKIPAKYNNKTELKKEVAAGESNAFDFELKSH
jgi:hypothetical protein